MAFGMVVCVVAQVIDSNSESIGITTTAQFFALLRLFRLGDCDHITASEEAWNLFRTVHDFQV